MMTKCSMSAPRMPQLDRCIPRFLATFESPAGGAKPMSRMKKTISATGYYEDSDGEIWSGDNYGGDGYQSEDHYGDGYDTGDD
jgi:hypothetical protein